MRRPRVLGELYRLPQQRTFTPGSRQAARARIRAAIAEIDRKLARLAQGEAPASVGAFRSIGEASREQVEASLRKARQRLMRSLF
jgi:hypothetical protein